MAQTRKTPTRAEVVAYLAAEAVPGLIDWVQDGLDNTSDSGLTRRQDVHAWLRGWADEILTGENEGLLGDLEQEVWKEVWRQVCAHFGVRHW